MLVEANNPILRVAGAQIELYKSKEGPYGISIFSFELKMENQRMLCKYL